MDLQTAAKTGIDTLATSAILLHSVPDATGDLKAPVIALVSSVVIQLTLKALNFVLRNLSSQNNGGKSHSLNRKLPARSEAGRFECWDIKRRLVLPVRMLQHQMSEGLHSLTAILKVFV